MLVLENVSKSFGSRPALAPTMLDCAPAKTTVLIGPSGCGKSTLLRIALGLIPADAGRVVINGAVLTKENAGALRRKIGYVVQDGGLFPHLTAERNVSLVARVCKRPEGEIRGRVAELAQLARLSPEQLARHPFQLSGGQRQRVALMRALMLDPAILLLDEPLGALDPITRREMQGELKTIFTRLGKTVVLVTHDMNEAAYFGDDIVLMRDGRVVQRGALAQLLNRPAEQFVADFITSQRSLLPAKEDA